MATTNTKKNTKEPKIKKAAAKSSLEVTALTGILLRPRITEKATMNSEANVYTFEVSPRATKPEIAKAIKSLYKVTPVKITVMAIPKKSVFLRGNAGVKGGGKKAFVFLKKGDKIEFI